jgi:hypothetical protein
MTKEEFMKKGFFKLLGMPVFLLASLQLSGCATLFDFGEEEDSLGYDRGYESRSADDCEGRFCDTEAEAGEEDEDVASREPASGTHKFRKAIDSRDVILGMTRQDVMSSWGEPIQKEVAGRGKGGHERWTYGSRYSLSGTRTVIFEDGKVAGWDR